MLLNAGQIPPPSLVAVNLRISSHLFAISTVGWRLFYRRARPTTPVTLPSTCTEPNSVLDTVDHLYLHWVPGHPPSRTGPLARKYLPGFPYSWSLRRLRQKIYCSYPSAAQEQPMYNSMQVDQICTTSACTSINNKTITLKKNYFTTASWGPLKKKQNPGASGTCPVCPLVKTALSGPVY